MYRVELKAVPKPAKGSKTRIVPNVPCGVESHSSQHQRIQRTKFLMYRVELKGQKACGYFVEAERFLMYRVELKVWFPCQSLNSGKMFLMYRVELKEGSEWSSAENQRGFLMYRVELKVSFFLLQPRSTCGVPNVPCGVKSATTSGTLACLIKCS